VPPTIVLVHGAFAESASWDGVIDRLLDANSTVIAAANPLRSLGRDADAVSDLVSSLEGPVLLVAHSYGGAVISGVRPGKADICGLVYVAAFAPDAGESCFDLASKFPGSTLGEAVEPVRRSDGTTDLFIERDRFHAQFCADLPARQAARMAATQRPATQEALTEAAGSMPLWKDVPSSFLIATEDRNIPAQLQRFMAERAGAHHITEVDGASHAVAVSQPDTTARFIREAAALPVAV
jgi:pimeloyl-ACP methyl ester carboxylesterase